MNKELELEAEKYGWKIKINSFSDPVKANELAKSASDDFIAGATSKYVEKQKLEFAIEQLKKASMLIVSQHERKANLRIIIELEQKLSEL